MKNTSVKRNTYANYANSFIASTFGFVSIPILIRLLGPENYAIAAIYGSIQAIILIFDLGWTTLNGRQIARLRAGTISKKDFEEYFKSVQIIFFITIILIALVSLFFSENLSSFLNPDSILKSEISILIKIMIASASFKFVITLYRSSLIAFERQVESSIINVTSISLRYMIALGIMYLFNLGLYFYLIFQLIVSLLELLIYSIKLRTSVNFSQYAFLNGASFRPLKDVYRFSGIIALTSGIWILTSQIDRILILGNFALSDFGYYAPIIAVASLIQILIAPLSTALKPKINIEYQNLDHSKGDKLILLTTRIIAFIAIPIASTIFFCSKFIVEFMLDIEISSSTNYLSTLLKYMALAYLCTAFSSIIYFYQVALGRLKWHLISAVLHPIIYIPMLYILLNNFGIIGVGYSLLISNAFTLLIFSIIVLNVYKYRYIITWYKDIFILIAFVFIPLSILYKIFYNIILIDYIEIFLILMFSFIFSFYAFLYISYKRFVLRNPIRFFKKELSEVR